MVVEAGVVNAPTVSRAAIIAALGFMPLLGARSGTVVPGINETAAAKFQMRLIVGRITPDRSGPAA